MKSTQPKTLEVEVLKPAKPAIIPKLKGGGDAQAAKKLLKLYSDAQNGMRKIIALGLAAWEIKEGQLKHGEFGPWLAAHAPKLCRPDSATGKPKASSQLSGYMELTKNVLEGVGIKTIGDYNATVAKFPNSGICQGGGLLLLADKKVPEEAKPLREKIFALVDGKTQRQLFLEFKQAEDDDEGNPTVKRGRVKGSSGLTKEQRALAEQRAEEERLTELEEQAKETTIWLLENSDAKHLGMLDSKVLANLLEAAQTMDGFILRVLESRKGSN